MATGTNGIATEGEAKSKLGYTGSVDTNKCCTKARAIAMGADGSKLTSYKDNQLVKYNDIIKFNPKLIINITFTLNDGSYLPGDEGYGFYIRDKSVNSENGYIDYEGLGAPPFRVVELTGVEGICKNNLTITRSILYSDTDSNIKLENIWPIFGNNLTFRPNSSDYDKSWDFSDFVDNEYQSTRWRDFWLNDILSLDFSKDQYFYWEIYAD